MRTWLLVALLVSDLSPLGDGDWIMDHLRCHKLLLSRQKNPNKVLELILTKTEYNRMHFQRHHRAHRVHYDHGHTHQDMTGIIYWIQNPALAVSSSYEEGIHVHTFLVKSNNLLALHVISEMSHIATDIFKKSPDLRRAWLHHQFSASSHNFPAFLLEKAKSGAPITVFQLQEMLIKRCCTTVTVIISRCAEDGGIKSAMTIKKTSKQEVSQPEVRQKQNTQRGMDLRQALMQYDGQCFLICHQDIVQTTMLHSGSSCGKNSDKFQLDIQRHVFSVMRTNEHLNLDKDSDSPKNFQRQFSLKASNERSDGFYVQKQPLLESRDSKGSINRPQYAIRPAKDDNNEYFIGKINTEEVKLRRLEGESKTKELHANTMEIGGKKLLAYKLQTHCTQKIDDDDIRVKHMLSDVGEEALFTLFLQNAETETQTEASNERKLVPNTDMRWKTVKLLKGDPPLMNIAVQDFIIELNKLTFKCLRGTDITALRLADPIAEVTTASSTTEKTEHSETNNTPRENVSTNPIKEENVPLEESVIPTPLRAVQTETTTTGHLTEATTIKSKTQETTFEVFSQLRAETADGQPRRDESPTTTVIPEPETVTEPRFRKYTTENIQTTTKKKLSGLRMREDTQVIPTKLQKGTETERKEDKNDPGIKLMILPKSSEAVHKEASNNHLTASTDMVPLCRGLIHRNEAGWKHCMQRNGGPASKMFSIKDAPDSPEEKPIREYDRNPVSDDENDHFYYLDGVLKSVWSNFYPFYNRKKHQPRSHSNTENGVTERNKRDSHENLLSYIKRLTERNKLNHLK